MIKAYITYLTTIKGYSELTATAYGKDLRDFAAWLKQRDSGKRWSTVTLYDVDDYIKDLVHRGLKPSSTNRRLSAISGFYRFLKRQGYEVENPCKFESRRKLATTVPNTIPAEDLQRAYDNAHGAAKIMLGLFCTTGIRLQELLDLTWNSIDFKTNELRIMGKGSKERLVYTTAEMLETLRNVKALPGHDDNDKIFTIDQRDARRLIWEALHPYSKAPQLSPHAIRHTFATEAAHQGNNVTTLAQTLGHKRIETTQRYIDLTKAPIKTLCESTHLLH